MRTNVQIPARRTLFSLAAAFASPSVAAPRTNVVEPRRDLVTLVSNDVYSTFRYEYDAAGRRVSKNDESYYCAEKRTYVADPRECH